MKSASSLERTFHQKIPITRAMGVRVRRCTAEDVLLTAPLSKNRNHLKTGFGGSLSALATLAGYGMTWNILAEMGLERTSHVVVQRSAIEYLKPVRSELRALCKRPSPAAVKRFKVAFADRGKGRLRLRVVMGDEARPSVTFVGQFVALR
ncbi:MAG TPA: YiiD C-terminal domain-containing protein [Opitutaceae bacterium]|nr:YiiD C-terminal domain-containing protein [Opitutaceae bacterium]